jgi:DNA-directed RNA polymerase specialized sigma24 family protein
MDPTPGLAVFPSTHWSIVAAAAADDTPGSTLALGELLRRYRSPLVTHIRFRFGAPQDDAEDFVHSFIEQKVLRRHLLGQARQGRGKFRAFLLEVLDNFVRDQFRRQNRQKRKGETVPLDGLSEQESAQLRTEATARFDRHWARTVIEEAVERMRRECACKNRANLWEVFEARLLRPLFEGVKPPRYDDLVRQFGFRSPAEAANLLITAKRMFRRNLISVVGEYVEGTEDVEAELRELQAIVTRGP